MSKGTAVARISRERELKVADEVWIATALLHREHPEATDFGIQEIVERAQREGLYKPLRRGVYVHAVQHCVANRAPNPGRYRMLIETRPARRRLFRVGDSYDPRREGAKMVPHEEDMPHGYRGLLSWYERWSMSATNDLLKNDPLLALRGSGKQIWAGEHADDYVRRLREAWE
jgi:hypothetical protein